MAHQVLIDYSDKICLEYIQKCFIYGSSKLSIVLQRF